MPKLFIELKDDGKDTLYSNISSTLDLCGKSAQLARDQFLKQVEKYKKYAGDIGDGYATIGYGFAMDMPGNQAIWERAFAGRDDMDFDEYIKGKTALSEADADVLFTVTVNDRQKSLLALRDFRGICFSNNELVTLVSLYYNSPKTVGPGLRAAIRQYKLSSTAADRSDGFQNVLIEIIELSTTTLSALIIGISNRRLQEASIFAGKDRLGKVSIPWRHYHKIKAIQPSHTLVPASPYFSALPYSKLEQSYTGGATARSVAGRPSATNNIIQYGSSSPDELTVVDDSPVMFGGDGDVYPT